MSDKADHVLDLLYMAAVEHELWPQAMDALSDLVGGFGSALTRFDIRDGSGDVLPSRSDPAMLETYFSHWADRNPLHATGDPETYVENWAPTILLDTDWMERERLVTTDYFNEFLSPMEADSTMMIRLALEDGAVSVLNIARPARMGLFGQAELETIAHLHGDVIRAFRMSRRLSEVGERQADAAQAFEQSSEAFFVLDADRRVRRLNAAARRLLGTAEVLDVVGGRLLARRPDADRRLQRLIGTAGERGRGPVAAGEAGGEVILYPLRQGTPVSVLVTPAVSDRSAIFLGRSVLVSVKDVRTRPKDVGELLGQRYALTPAEVRVAMALYGGATTREAAERVGASVNTVRVQLASIFNKMGVHRQSELVRHIADLDGAVR